jgi:hypothetical protein
MFTVLVHLVPFHHEIFGEDLDRYWSVLTGNQQTPRTNTNAVGFIALKFEDDITRLLYIVNVENIKNVTGASLNNGSSNNQNGTVVLNLLNGTRELRRNVDRLLNESEDGRMTGTLVVGGATKDDLQGTLEGKSLSNLKELMVNGSVYVNIKTKEFPHGEILGDNFVGIDRIFPDFTDFKWG